MKKLFGVLCLTFILLSSTGCMRCYSNLTANPDGTITKTDKSAISKEYLDSTGETPDSTAQLETLEDGKQYYTSSETVITNLQELRKENGAITLTKDIFYYDLGGEEQNSEISAEDYTLLQAISQGIYVKMTIQLGDTIIDTNANVAADTKDNVATFDSTFMPTAWYAYTAEGKRQIEADTTAPIISGIKKNKVYKTIPDFTFTDDVATARITLNDKPLENATPKQGKNTLTVFDIKGNSSSVTFYHDSKSPIIKGIKQGKTYHGKATIYVKDKQGIAKITINKKKQKLSKKKLVKRGKYKGYYKLEAGKAGKNVISAYDKAGNKKTITIRIVK